MTRKRNIILLVLIIMAPLSCEKIQQLPPEPYISFRDFVMFDSTDILGNTHKAGILGFYFEDGDGDIGLEQPLPGDTNPDTTNLTFYLYKKDNGLFNEPADTFGYRVPYMERTGQNKILQGAIQITFLYIGYSPEDTIKYEFFLEDRAGNISNTSESCEIVFSGDGGCIE
jgi:hypothetical protein